ncbi:MAG: hypothetical protein JWN44_5488 [Myxococcales bacterium]|nr:hypothetical protein [Myxococcales bacterium]
MHVLRAVVTRAVVVGLIALSGSGCLIGFDAGRLTGGAAADAGTTDASEAPGDLGRLAGCDDFSSYTPGTALPNWIDGRGTWRVIMMAQTKVLAQTTASMSRNDRFLAWQAGKDYTDASISAVATVGNVADANCVLARVQDASNYYALCVQDVSGRNHSPAHEWRLNRMSADVETRLASGSIAVTDSHSFALRVQGSSLIASVDGDPKPTIVDETLLHGALGVSTDDQGGFSTLCIVAQ